MIVEIQVLPTPAGTPERRWGNVAAAIEEIERSGLIHEVGPLGTSIEGAPDEVWGLVRRAHEVALAGAQSVVTVLKVVEMASSADDVTIAELVGDHRDPR